MRSDLTTDSIVDFLVQTSGDLLPSLQRHEGVDPLPFKVVRHANNRCLRNRGMPTNRPLNLRGADPVTRNIDHVIHTASDPVIPVFITTTAVTGEILTGIQSKVGLTKTF